MGIWKKRVQKKKKNDQKVRRNFGSILLLWYTLHSIMTCKYDKIWKWQWVGESGQVYWVLKIIFKIFAFCLLRNPQSSIAPSFLSVTISLFSFTLFAVFSSHSLIQLFSPLSSAHPLGTLEVRTLEKLYRPKRSNQSHLQNNCLCCPVAPWIIESSQC